MKRYEFKQLTLEELRAKLKENAEEAEKLRFQQALQQLEHPHKIRQVRREMARIRTLLREHELGIRERKDK